MPYDSEFRSARWRGRPRRRHPAAGPPSRSEIEREFRHIRPPRKPAHGYPVRGYHTYDLDYGGLGGPTEYSGRAGYDAGAGARDGAGGRRRPTLAELGRAARLRRQRQGPEPRERWWGWR